MTDAPSELKVRPNDVLRFVLELFAVFSLGFWGFAAWPWPLNLVFGILTPAIAIVLWGLFRSPKAVFHVDPFVRALVEIIVMASAALAWLAIGQPIVALVFAVLATASGVVNGRREFS